MSRSVHFSSANSEWETPQPLFNRINALFGPFTLDACANVKNKKCPAFYCKAQDALTSPWPGRVWMNPPYGRVIGDWMAKAFSEAQCGSRVVCLVPARTDTAWWHNYAAKGYVVFLRGRVRFIGGKSCAPFPSALVVFDFSPKSSLANSTRYGL